MLVKSIAESSKLFKHDFWMLKRAVSLSFRPPEIALMLIQECVMEMGGGGGGGALNRAAQAVSQSIHFKISHCWKSHVAAQSEMAKGSILQYFLPALSYHLSSKSLFDVFLSGHSRLVLLYCKCSKIPTHFTFYSQRKCW